MGLRTIFLRMILGGTVFLAAALSFTPLAASARGAGTQDSGVQGSAAQITYTFEHPGLQPASYILLIREDGSGHYHSTPGPAANADAPSAVDDILPTALDRDVRIEEPLRSQLFQYARGHRFFGGTCDRGGKKLAFTGKKTLTYSGGDGQGSCAFDWLADPALQRLSDQLISTAYTIEVGRRLDVELKHSRLGIDAELEAFQDAVRDQRAAGLSNIAPELEAIAGDEGIMQRARARARALLGAVSGQ
jgi:hypothetical protein